MNFNTSSHPLKIRLSFLCLTAGLVTVARAQNYSPIVTDRIMTGFDEVPIVSDDSRHRDGLELGAVLSVAYDSNIYLSRKNEVHDQLTRIGASVAYAKGDPKEGEGGFIKFAYQPTGVVYAENRDGNRVDQIAAMSTGWKWSSASLAYSVSAKNLGDATPDTGQQTDRLEFDHEVLAAWSPRQKITLELAAGSRDFKYSDPSLYDSSETFVRSAIRYAYSPKTQIGLAYQIGDLKVDGGNSQKLQQITADLAWQPREKIKINLKAGLEHRNSKSGSESNPLLDGKIEWSPRVGTQIYLSGYQRQQASAYYAGQNYESVGVSAGVSQRLGNHWSARVEAGKEKVDYSRVSGAGSAGRNDTIWFVRPALDYKLTDAFDVSIFYQISNDSSSDTDFGYRQQLAGIELNYKF